MQKKLTITIDEQVYEALHQVIGRRKISEFIERLIRPFPIPLIRRGLDSVPRNAPA